MLGELVVGRLAGSDFGSEEARLKADRNRRHDHAGLM